MQVPDFDREVVPRDHVAARVGELDVGDGGDYLGEEAAIRRVFGLLEHCNEIMPFHHDILDNLRLYEEKKGAKSQSSCLSIRGLTFGVSITERGLPHVAEADGSLARGVDEEVAFARMELAGSDHLREEQLDKIWNVKSLSKQIFCSGR